MTVEEIDSPHSRIFAINIISQRESNQNSSSYSSGHHGWASERGHQGWRKIGDNWCIGSPFSEAMTGLLQCPCRVFLYPTPNGASNCPVR